MSNHRVNSTLPVTVNKLMRRTSVLRFSEPDPMTMTCGPARADAASSSAPWYRNRNARYAQTSSPSHPIIDQSRPELWRPKS